MAEDNVWLNGHLLPANAAQVSVWDAGFLHGFSTFTTMLAHRGVVFRLDRHLARLADTVRLLDLRTDATVQTLAEGVDALLKANGLAEARVRITLTPGSTRDERPTTLITADPLPTYPREWYAKGIGVVVSSFRQHAGDPIYGHKTGNYLARLLAQKEAAVKGMQEALWYTPDHRLAEACFCNVFLVREGVVRTPPRDTPVLPGIVRDAVLELCAHLDIPHDQETPLYVRDMLDAEEIFLTASCSGIRPVHRVEAHTVGSGQPGEVTQRIMAAYRDLLEKECGGQ